MATLRESFLITPKTWTFSQFVLAQNTRYVLVVPDFDIDQGDQWAWLYVADVGVNTVGGSNRVHYPGQPLFNSRHVIQSGSFTSSRRLSFYHPEGTKWGGLEFQLWSEP